MYQDLTIDDCARLINSVVKMYMKYLTSTSPLDRNDLRQEAWTALMAAGLKYDPSRGVKASTHACLHIHFGIKDLLNDNNVPAISIENFTPQLLATEDSRYYDIEMKNLLDFALSELSLDERYLLNCRFIKGMTYRQIGQQEGKCHEQVRKNIKAALRKARRQVTNEDSYNC